MDLTEQQCRVINQVNGHLVVLAGPGSGKTRTIIEKIFYLFNHRIVPEPFGVLAITFTNAAANEMKARLRQKGFTNWDRIFIGTFHSFSRYLLTCYGSDIGVNENFNIMDSKLQLEVIKKIKPAANQREITSTLEVINNQKRSGIYPGIQDEKLIAPFRQVYSDYQNQLRQHNYLDYGDLINYAINLMRQSELASRLFKNYFRFVFVDEFQDTDHQQLELVKIFADSAIGSTIIADDDQSVFAWRGADRGNIKTIRGYLNADSCQLGINFRSDQAIVEAATAVINQDIHREKKKFQANSKNRGKIILKCFVDEKSEASDIAGRIKKYLDQGIVKDLGQVAIIVRVRYRANSIIETLNAQGITWFDRSRLSFEDGWETVFALSLIGQACEPNSSIRFHQLLSSTDLGGLANQHEDALDFVTFIRKEICKEMPSLNKLSTKAIHHILGCCGFWEILRVNCWSDTDFQNRSRNIERLLQNIDRIAQEYNLELLKIVDHLAGLGAVQILSGQESKGREFDYVFFAGLEEGTIPFYKANNEEKISEERRIFYVAMTRAKKELFLSYASNLMTSWGTIKKQARSRFIDAIPQELIQ